MREDDNKRLFTTILVGAGVQTFFVLLMGALVITQSPEWVLLACLLIFSLASLVTILSVGTIVTRIVESLKEHSTAIHKTEQLLRKMLRGPRSDGLMDVEEMPVVGSPEATHRDMIRRFGA